MKIEVGVSCYPEDWSKERGSYDADLMKKAGIVFVRMGEFSWSHMEIRENEFDFQWLHDAVRIFAEHGIRSVLCTPSSAAPAWMCSGYPEILSERRSGQKSWFGIRDHTCYTSPKYRFFVLRIAEKMAQEFRNDPNVFAWQIDNEPGCSRFSECFCPACQQEFRNYLRRKYGTVRELNRRWASAFWSGEFTDWNEIELDSHTDNMGACRTYDSFEFRSFILADFIHQQAAKIRAQIPDAVIGTNNYTRYDRYEGFSTLDYAGNDCYPWSTIGKKSSVDCQYSLNLYRGLIPGKKPWIMETHTAPGAPLRDLTDFYFRLFVGHGYDKICYFYWRSHLSGNEKNHPAILGPTGQPGLKYEMLCRLISETNRSLEKYPDLPPPKPRTAMVNDYRDHWIYAGSVPEQTEAIVKIQEMLFNALLDSGYSPEIISPTFDFSPYRLLVLPIQAHISKMLAKALEKFVSGGGTLLMNGRSGMFDGDAKLLPQTGPEHTEHLFGIRILEGMEFLQKAETFEPTAEFEYRNIVVSGSPGGKPLAGTATHWIGVLQTTTAEVLMTYKNSDLKGYPFLTVNAFGAGHAIYFASDIVDGNLLAEIIRYAERLANLPEKHIPEGVDVSIRGNLAFLSNFNESEVFFPTSGSVKNIIGNAFSNGIIRLGPQESAVVDLGSQTEL